eukprot:TRINITY_DN8418_c0_g1_i1.p1 TRINITY_DN8418_c0_g1~~TRINITY_DN8418_c0_g1_i1.p1  ORF type:complete len:1007 (+),score=425.13 TRINITY_DN8418_c0_g1_i1:60-3080(+)
MQDDSTTAQSPEGIAEREDVEQLAQQLLAQGITIPRMSPAPPKMLGTGQTALELIEELVRREVWRRSAEGGVETTRQITYDKGTPLAPQVHALETMVASLEAEIAALTNANIALTADNNEKEKRIEYLDDQRRGAEALHAKALKEIDRLRELLADQERLRRQELEDALKEIPLLKAKLAEKDTEIESWKLKYSQLEEANKKLLLEVEVLGRDLAASRAETERAQKRADDAERERDDLMRRMQAEIDGQVAEVTKKLRAAQDANEALNRRLKDALEEVEMSRSKLTLKQGEVDDLMKRLAGKDDEIDRLKAQARTLTLEMESIDKKLRHANNDIEMIQKQLRDKDEELQRMTQKFKEEEEVREGLQKALRQSEMEKETHLRRISQLEDDIARLERRLRDSEEENEELRRAKRDAPKPVNNDAELDDLRREIEILRNKLKLETQRAGDEAERNTQLQRQIDSIRDQSREREEALQKRIRELEDALQKRDEGLQKKIRDLEEEFKKREDKLLKRIRELEDELRAKGSIVPEDPDLLHRKNKDITDRNREISELRIRISELEGDNSLLRSRPMHPAPAPAEPSRTPSPEREVVIRERIVESPPSPSSNRGTQTNTQPRQPQPEPQPRQVETRVEHHTTVVQDPNVEFYQMEVARLEAEKEALIRDLAEVRAKYEETIELMRATHVHDVEVMKRGLDTATHDTMRTRFVRPGSRVMRNELHWKWADQDGGYGNRGTVKMVDLTLGWVCVKWDKTAVKDNYRWNNEDAWDVVLVEGGAEERVLELEGQLETMAGIPHMDDMERIEHDRQRSDLQAQLFAMTARLKASEERSAATEMQLIDKDRSVDEVRLALPELEKQLAAAQAVAARANTREASLERLLEARCAELRASTDHSAALETRLREAEIREETLSRRLDGSLAELRRQQQRTGSAAYAVRSDDPLSLINSPSVRFTKQRLRKLLPEEDPGRKVSPTRQRPVAVTAVPISSPPSTVSPPRSRSDRSLRSPHSHPWP